MACAIWGVVAEERKTGGDYREIGSPRAGGWYRIVGSVENAVAALPLPKKKSLSRWIHKQHELGVPMPEIHTGNLEQAISLPPLKFSQQVNAILLWLDHHNFRVGSAIEIKRGVNDETLASMACVTDANSADETASLLRTMAQMGLLTEGAQTSTTLRFGIAPSGWHRMEELNSVAAVDSSQAFVAMWFNPATEAAFSEGIAPAILQAGYNPLRIDKKQHLNKVDDEIIAEIRRSRFVVSDFTCEAQKPRGGVYFEAGFAVGLGIPVIWTCQASSLEDLHFDTRQYNHIVWQEPQDLLTQLLARIGAVIGDGPLRRR
jgi:hypothetical protein